MTDALGPVTDYLPHRPPMLFIDHIDEVTEGRVVCRATIHPDCVFANHGLVHPTAMIELVAQACAIFAGVTAARAGGGQRGVGFIVSCREVEFATNSFAVGDELTVISEKLPGPGDDPLASFNGRVIRAGIVCASVQLSVVDAQRVRTR